MCNSSPRNNDPSSRLSRSCLFVVGRCERTGQYDLALKLLDEMRKHRMRFYDIGILDELFKRLLAAVALLRGRGAAATAALSSSSNTANAKKGDGDRGYRGGGGGGTRRSGRDGTAGGSAGEGVKFGGDDHVPDEAGVLGGVSGDAEDGSSGDGETAAAFETTGDI